MKLKKGSLNIHWVIVILLALAVTAMLLSFREMKRLDSLVEMQVEVEQSRRTSEEEGQKLIVGSDYLTVQVWRFTALHDSVYMNNYWREVEVEQRRSKAVEALEKLNLTQEEEMLIYKAKTASDQLIEKEAWAMRLVLDSMGEQPENMPALVASVVYQDQEELLSSEEKADLANRYVFGGEYEAKKNEINRDLEDFQEILSVRKNQDLEEAMRNTNKASLLIQVYNSIVLALLMMVVVVFYWLVLRPFLEYSAILGRSDLLSGTKVQNAPLTPKGSKELRHFAETFNRIYNSWQIQNKRLRELNSVDFLTGIPNRAALDTYMQKQLNKDQIEVGVMMLDIDSFKIFNDNFGHLAGDQILKEVARCIQKAIPEKGGIAARLGGEEFVVVLPNTTSPEMDGVANEILVSVRNIPIGQITATGADIYSTISIGSTLWDGKKKATSRQLLHEADLALYQAKKNGKNQHVTFLPNDYSFIRLQSLQAHEAEVEAEMYDALNRGEFIPFYQPKYDIRQNRVAGAEALARWNHPQKGILLPGYFIPIFEENGFVTQIDINIFKQVCQTIRRWMDEKKTIVPIACNFSRLNFRDSLLAAKLEEIIHQYGVPASYLEIEVTESACIENEEYLIEELKKLREVGFSVAIDDFGSGYSSLGVLQEFPVDVLKIDRSFLQRDLNNTKNYMIIKGIMYIAKVLHLSVVCEGVEKEEQVELLKKTGCRLIQGYYYSRPVPEAEFEKMMKKKEKSNE